jgi:hypothetical protein
MHDRIEGLKRGLLGGIAGLAAMQLAHWVTGPLTRPRTPRPMDVFATERSISPLGPQHFPDEGATSAIVRIAYERLAHRPPSPRVKTALSWALHLGYGLLVASVYGAVRAPARRRRHGLRGLMRGRMRDGLRGAVRGRTHGGMRGAVQGGALLGLGLWLLGDELAMPLLGLSDKPTAYHPTEHVQSLVEHLGYGVATAAAARALGGAS